MSKSDLQSTVSTAVNITGDNGSVEPAATEEKKVLPVELPTTLFGDRNLLTIKTQEKVDAYESLHNKVIGLYFSAGWCPPCRKFTPVLKDLYGELRKRQWPFEVVFISCDKTENDMMQYMEEDHGPWLTLPFDDSLIADLKSRYKITCIPRLLIVKESGDIITSTGRKEVQDRGISSYRHWLEPAGFDLQLLKQLQKADFKGNNPDNGTNKENDTA